MEAMLKSAMQSQLDGVRVGLNQLQIALHEIGEIKQKYEVYHAIIMLILQLMISWIVVLLHHITKYSILTHVHIKSLKIVAVGRYASQL